MGPSWAVLGPWGSVGPFWGDCEGLLGSVGRAGPRNVASAQNVRFLKGMGHLLLSEAVKESLLRLSW
eukprot:2803408-Pyramimonas_sp.AAC.1